MKDRCLHMKERILAPAKVIHSEGYPFLDPPKWVRNLSEHVQW